MNTESLRNDVLVPAVAKTLDIAAKAKPTKDELCTCLLYTSTTAKDLTEKMLARGIAPEAIHMVKKEMEHWADGFTHPAENVEETVDELRMNPLIPKDVPIHGLIFHPRTGEIEVLVNGYTQMKQYYER